MKKRFRKKFAVGEFYRPWFAVRAQIEEMADGDQADFVSRFIAEAEAFGMVCEGAIGDTDLEVALDTGRINTNNEERRQQFLEQIQKFTEIVKVEVTDLQ